MGRAQLSHSLVKDKLDLTTGDCHNHDAIENASIATKDKREIGFTACAKTLAVRNKL
ncbi:hypothetical protein MesoLj113b_69850 (plasmid) [Mesorhizobium sp. 113-3-3]|nr:hypothetical protein MesoLj113b_69850 [Mesorhizobium sp. 113-3-3]